jgi:hypothetical protein
MIPELRMQHRLTPDLSEKNGVRTSITEKLIEGHLGCLGFFRRCISVS